MSDMYPISFEYQKTHSFEYRLHEYQKIQKKYPYRCLVICEVLESSKKLIKLDKCKFLVPEDLTVGQFFNILRKKINIDESQTIFIFTENSYIPNSMRTINELRQSEKNADGYLYLGITIESTFGNSSS